MCIILYPYVCIHIRQEQNPSSPKLRVAFLLEHPVQAARHHRVGVLTGAASGRVVRETGGAPRNPARRNHFWVWTVKSPGCRCTDAFGGKSYRRVPTLPRSTSPFSDVRQRATQRARARATSWHRGRLWTAQEPHFGILDFLRVHMHLPAHTHRCPHMPTWTYTRAPTYTNLKMCARAA